VFVPAKAGVLLAVLFAALLCARPTPSEAASLCETCEIQVGVGSTYHFWGTTGGVVVPVLVNWNDARYEVGFFRMTTAQVLQDGDTRYNRLMAQPYWGVSLSRRWTLYRSGPLRLFFGFGFAGKTRSDQLSSTRWDFASQLGLRFQLPDKRVTAELVMRHWSNAGIRLPNHGQDFATFTFNFNPGVFATD